MVTVDLIHFCNSKLCHMIDFLSLKWLEIGSLLEITSGHSNLTLKNVRGISLSILGDLKRAKN
jgi:hypothetical protein